MLEKEYALKLKNKIETYLIPNKEKLFCEYAKLNQELAQCDYRTLQAECEKLGFHIYNFKESPVYQNVLSKEKCSKLKSYVIYSDYTLTLVAKFKA